MAKMEVPPPKVDVMFADQPWDTQLQADFVGVDVTDRLDAADCCLLHFENPEFRYHNHKSLAVGTPVEVRLGWGDTCEPVFYGEVVGTEMIFPRVGPPKIVVKAFDRLFRLMRKKQERTLLDMTDSDVAKKVAGEHGLKSDVDSTSVKHAYLLQSGESDWDFVTARAMRSGRVVRVENKTLTFKDALQRPDPVRTLTREVDLPGLRLDTSIESMPSGITVQGWDPASKKKIEGKATTTDIKSELKTTELGADLGKQALGEAIWLIQNAPVDSTGSAEHLAKSAMREMVSDFISGEFTIQGDANLRAGAVVELAGLGKRMSGGYFINVSHHHCDDKGYTTKCEISRNGWVPPPPKPPKEEEAKTETVDINVQVVDSLGNPVANADYAITLADGKVRKGKTDDNGKIAESSCPKGPYKIEVAESFLSILEKE